MNHIEWSQAILYDLSKSWLKNPTQVSPHVKLEAICIFFLT